MLCLRFQKERFFHKKVQSKLGEIFARDLEQGVREQIFFYSKAVGHVLPSTYLGSIKKKTFLSKAFMCNKKILSSHQYLFPL